MAERIDLDGLEREVRLALWMSYNDGLALIAELRTARGLLAKAKEVLPRYLFGHDSDLRNGSPECRCSTCERARALLGKPEDESNG